MNAHQRRHSACTLDAKAFWQLAKELGAPHWKAEVLLQFEGEPVRRVMVTRAGALKAEPVSRADEGSDDGAKLDDIQ